MSDEAKEILAQIKERYPWAPPEIINVMFKAVGHVYDLNDKPQLMIANNDVRLLVAFIEKLLKEKKHAVPET